MGDFGGNCHTFRELPIGQQRIAFMPSPSLSEKIANRVMEYGHLSLGDDGIPYFEIGTGSEKDEMGNEIGTRRLQVRYMMPDQALSGAREMYQNSGNSINREINIRLVDRGHAFHGFGGDMNDNASYVASISPKSGIDFCRFLQKEDQQKVYKQLLTDVAELLGVR
ncbi:MAG: hypothetical protein A2787_10180 [Omnitrophica WOR_2 bacterium RIFCSPHIGHO2_01_FULL_48_9]|nr:MAG: hypothetical protein A2787_10180 [Omnitrophica WOR_2 bacterium RIFCSPHIGHO2_01_FULL_48_9]